jgi:hypothetical protein
MQLEVNLLSRSLAGFFQIPGSRISREYTRTRAKNVTCAKNVNNRAQRGPSKSRLRQERPILGRQLDNPPL